MRPFFALALLSLACAGPIDAGTVERPVGDASCYVGGCSSQVCSDRPDVVTTCEWLPEYACYRSARCERQANGACGWTETPELLACLAKARAG